MLENTQTIHSVFLSVSDGVFVSVPDIESVEAPVVALNAQKRTAVTVVCSKAQK